MAYNNYFASNFARCRLLATARDPHRDRAVQLFQIPGEPEFVGVFDGVDKWISPISIDPFSAGVARIIAKLESAPHPTERRRINVQQTTVPPAQQPLPGFRRRVIQT
jgi:hypothetical protein